jgi:hypothetical protein
LKAFEQNDTYNDGTVSPHEFNQCLRILDFDFPSIELECFIRFIEKGNRGRIDYMQFMHKMKRRVIKNHNPFKNLLMRLNVFLRQNGQQPEQLVKRISANLNHTETKHVNPTEKAKVPISYFAKFLKAKVDKK